jgi:hypothetical protein
MMRDL